MAATPIVAHALTDFVRRSQKCAQRARRARSPHFSRKIYDVPPIECMQPLRTNRRSGGLGAIRSRRQRNRGGQHGHTSDGELRHRLSGMRRSNPARTAAGRNDGQSISAL